MNAALLSTVLALSMAAAPAQLIAPLVPSGQPALMPFVPMAVGMIPPPAVWAFGNPAFALATFAPPPVPVGLPTFLVIGIATPPVPIPPPFAFPAFGPALLTNTVLIVLPGGLSGPMPGPLVPLPLPATGGPVPLLSVHTLAIAGASIILTGALGITI